MRQKGEKRMKRILIGIFVLAIALGLAACTQLKSEGQMDEANLSFQELAKNDAIPASYGKLVSVTSTEKYPGWAQLWFEKEDGTITTVLLNFQTGTLRHKILVTPRS
jgi:hypothetical protein